MDPPADLPKKRQQTNKQTKTLLLWGVTMKHINTAVCILWNKLIIFFLFKFIAYVYVTPPFERRKEEYSAA